MSVCVGYENELASRATEVTGGWWGLQAPFDQGMASHAVTLVDPASDSLYGQAEGCANDQSKRRAASL
jgi:hypothetical protein